MSKNIYCPVCSTKLHRKDIECCSRSCATKLHWKRNPEMTKARSAGIDKVNSKPFSEEHKKNISKSRMGKSPWNKDKKGLQEAWNKGLPAEKQPFYGKIHTTESNEKRRNSIQLLIDNGMRFQDFAMNKTLTTEQIDVILKEDPEIDKHLDKIFGII